MPPADKIIQLRKILAERFPQGTLPTSTFLSTGVTGLDLSLGGGLRRGAVAQVVVPHPSGGSALLLHDIIQTPLPKSLSPIQVEAALSYCTTSSKQCNTGSLL